MLRRLAWMLDYRKRHGKLPRCPFKGCKGFATHTWWGYQDDDLRDVDTCWRHSNNKQEVIFKKALTELRQRMEERKHGDRNEQRHDDDAPSGDQLAQEEL